MKTRRFVFGERLFLRDPICVALRTKKPSYDYDSPSQ